MIRSLTSWGKPFLTVLLIIPFISACGSVSTEPVIPTGAVAGSSAVQGEFVPGTGTCNQEPRYDNQNLGAIRGRLHVSSYTREDQSFVGAYVHLIPTDQETSTDSSGFFVFDNLKPAMYQIDVRTREGLASTTQVRARAGMVCFMDEILTIGMPNTGDNASAAPTPDFSTIYIVYNGLPANGAYLWFEGDNHVLMADSAGVIRLRHMPAGPVHVAFNGHWAYYIGPVASPYFSIIIGDQDTQPVFPQNPIYIRPESQPFDLPSANP